MRFLSRSITGFLIVIVSMTGCVQESAQNPVSQDNNQKYESSPFGFHPAIPYDDARYAGIKWTRGTTEPYIFWSLVDPYMNGDPNRFIWRLRGPGQTGRARGFDYDNIGIASDSGLNILLNIDVQPREGGYTRPGSWMPLDPDAYRAFVIATVKRYPYVRYWQIGNEPTANLSDYGEFMRLSYDAVKEGNPNASVLIGGVSGMGMPETFEDYQATFDSAYLPLLQDIAREKTRCFDIFDFHWYGNASGDYQLTKEIHQYIIKKLESLKIPDPKSFWITEMGTYSGDPQLRLSRFRQPRDFPYQSERQQAADLVKRNVYPLSHGIGKIFMAFGLQEGFKHDQGYFDFTGLIYNGEFAYDQGKGAKKIGYFTYKKMTEVLEGADFKHVETIKAETNNIFGLYLFRFSKNGKHIYVGWIDVYDHQSFATEKIDTTVTVETDKGEQKVEIIDALPRYQSGTEVTDYIAAFDSEEKRTEHGKVTITLTEIPRYVY
jgi:hypothetical protein